MIILKSFEVRDNYANTAEFKHEISVSVLYKFQYMIFMSSHHALVQYLYAPVTLPGFINHFPSFSFTSFLCV